MHPAFSVIFFTTLSGAGYGLLFWSALAALAGTVSARVLLWSVMLGVAMTVIGLLSSTFHLGKPLRAWRAFSQWRTSWLSREGVLAVLVFPFALLLAMALLPAMLTNDPVSSMPALNMLGKASAVALLLLAPATVWCTAMIYASLKPIPAWRHRLVVPVYLAFALLTGGLLLAAFDGQAGAHLGNMPAFAGVVMAIALWLAKRRYWHDIDNAALPQSRGDAIGLPARTPSVFERPHTEANYITREMGFVVARRHSHKLRVLAALLFAVMPILLMLPVWLFVHLDSAPWFAAAALCALAGAFVERWLFFAEAKHMVTLYY